MSHLQSINGKDYQTSGPAWPGVLTVETRLPWQARLVVWLMPCLRRLLGAGTGRISVYRWLCKQGMYARCNGGPWRWHRIPDCAEYSASALRR